MSTIKPQRMKAVILAGGLGTRLSEETVVKPKPMVEIGQQPVLWHIMKIYSHYGINDFIICAGYRSYFIKEYFANYFLHTADVTFDVCNDTVEVHTQKAEPWRVTVIDTGERTMTGGRLNRIKSYLGEGTFCLTYGDGLSNINIPESIDFHRRVGGLATLTAVQPPGRFGAIRFSSSQTNFVSSFEEKPSGDGGWINGGFFVLETDVLDYIKEGDKTIWEREPLANLAADGQLSAYRHEGFWHPMDTLRDKMELDSLWNEGNAPWKVWN